jgi:hypothetical protein
MIGLTDSVLPIYVGYLSFQYWFGVLQGITSNIICNDLGKVLTISVISS